MTRATRRMHGIAAGLVEVLVVGAEIVDVEQQQRDLGLVALRERQSRLQQVFEVGARAQAGEPVLAHPVGQAADAGVAGACMRAPASR